MVWIVLGTLGIVLAMIGLGVAIDRRYPLLPRPEDGALDELPPPPPPPTGETAATAAPADARARLVARARCCGAAMTEAGNEPILYDGRQLLIVRLRCDRCGAIRSRYLAPP